MVAILNRTRDIADSSFQIGQKLFANPSGNALATSGYRVGHATHRYSISIRRPKLGLARDFRRLHRQMAQRQSLL